LSEGGRLGAIGSVDLDLGVSFALEERSAWWEKRGQSNEFFVRETWRDGGNTLRDTWNGELLLRKRTYISGDGGPDGCLVAPA
jgi:hypothetical protein